jgi:hypothetical protein
MKAVIPIYETATKKQMWRINVEVPHGLYSKHQEERIRPPSAVKFLRLCIEAAAWGSGKEDNINSFSRLLFRRVLAKLRPHRKVGRPAKKTALKKN